MFVTNFWTCDRQQDVRATEIDKVEMHSSFRPGDIVKALVVSSILTEHLFFHSLINLVMRYGEYFA